jgi:hypothetical protein
VPLWLCGLRRGAALLVTAATLSSCSSRHDRGTLPHELSAADFWRLSTELSEAPGVFRHSDNLVSNELLYVHTVPRLRPRGGVYVGVGPEQNFSYIARLQPAMAFVVDIRQENRNLHLLYKALFESSRNRAEFLARLFSRDIGGDVGDASEIDALFAALAVTAPSPSRLAATSLLVRDRLVGTHKLPLSADELASIDAILYAFLTNGPAITYGSTLPQSDPHPSYQTLMTARDLGGQNRSFLADEASFTIVKALQAKHLIVPVVGDFGAVDGAIHRVGVYTRQHGSLVSAFYSSNVEVYLSNQQMNAYCRSLADLPVDDRTTFISNKWLRPFALKLRACRPRTTLTWDPENK